MYNIQKVKWSNHFNITIDLLDLLDLPVILSHCVAFMTDLNVGQIISNTDSLVLVQF